MWHPWKKGLLDSLQSPQPRKLLLGSMHLASLPLLQEHQVGLAQRSLVSSFCDSLRGAHVVMAVRNVESGRKVKDNIIIKIPDAKIDVMEMDLSSMESVRRFSAEYNSSGLPLNILVDSGTTFCTFPGRDRVAICYQSYRNTRRFLEKNRDRTEEARRNTRRFLEGHFLLTNLLLDTMKRTAVESKKEGRTVNVSSTGHRIIYREGIRFDKINDPTSYWSLCAYGQSKLANMLHANELARRFKEEGVNITANSVHPGRIMTNVWGHSKLMEFGASLIFSLSILKSVEQGAAPPSYLALNPQVQGVSGEYFVECDKAEASGFAKDSELAKKLWEFSLKLT